MQVKIAKPQAIILDFLSTAIKAGFIEKGLFAYVRKHGRAVIEQLWAKKDFKELVAKVRRQVRRDKRSQDDVPEMPEKNATAEQQQQALYDNIIWYLDHQKETSAHYKIKFAIYEAGYEQDKLVTHVYTDVAKNLKVWSDAGIKIYIFSNAWVKAQKMFMAKTNHGQLDQLITGFFDTSDIGEPTDSNSFKKLTTQIGAPAGEIVFLTKGIAEGKAAKEAGIHAILVISHSHQLKRYEKEDLDSFQRLRSFDELALDGAPAEEAAAPAAQEGATDDKTKRSEDSPADAQADSPASLEPPPAEGGQAEGGADSPAPAEGGADGAAPADGGAEGGAAGGVC
ncbi:Enolase-phosphatase E1 [Halotydeus destructor]|nr:Enolase-phosphatase E1 [Halotydeus destructor]